MRNVEAKFRLDDLERVRERAVAIGFEPRATLIQRDTFFATARGKLKLREEPAGAALIFYRRDNLQSLMLSHYEIVPVADPAATRAILAGALGVLAELRKHRTLLLRGSVRMHLDRVEGLGEFGELEAVMGEGERPEERRAEVDTILEAIGVGAAGLIDRSYFELLAR